VLVGGDGRNSNAIETITGMILAAGEQFRQRQNSRASAGNGAA